MDAMGSPVGGVPIPVMNPGTVALQVAPRRIQVNDNKRTMLNTYIYEYFLRYGMFDCACAILNSDSKITIRKDSPGGRHNGDEDLMGSGRGDLLRSTGSMEDTDSKHPDDLPTPNVPNLSPDSCFLYVWFCLFWDMFNAQDGKDGSGQEIRYINHDTSRQAKLDISQHQMMWMQNKGGMNMDTNKIQGNTIARTDIAHSRNNPQTRLMLQQKQGQMHHDTSAKNANRARPASPGSVHNAPSSFKRRRLDQGCPFNPNQGGMTANDRPLQGMQSHQTFSTQSPAVQAKAIATNAANPWQHRGSQMPNKPLPNATCPQAQGLPALLQARDGIAFNTLYNLGERGAGDMNAGTSGGNAGGGNNQALQAYHVRLMLMEQQNKKRFDMARQEQDISGPPRNDSASGGRGCPGGLPGPNAQPFQSASSQGVRPTASSNPAMSRQYVIVASTQHEQQQKAGHSGPQMRRQGGPNRNRIPRAPQGRVYGMPQQRSMPLPSAPAKASNNANSRNITSSPRTTNTPSPTPSQLNKTASKETKKVKGKTATQKSSNSNPDSRANPTAEAAPEPEPSKPATHVTPDVTANLDKQVQNAGPPQAVSNGQPATPAPAPVAPRAHAQNATFNLDSPNAIDFGSMDFANALTSGNVLNDFDFDSLLQAYYETDRERLGEGDVPTK